MTSGAVVQTSVKLQFGWIPSSSPGYIAAMMYCCNPPPEHPFAIVYRITPYRFTMCSFSIITASADTLSFAFSPWTLRPELATMNPRDNAVSGDHQFRPPPVEGLAVTGWSTTADGAPCT